MEFLLIPVAAVVLASAYVRWTGRVRKPLDPVDSVEAHQRALAALDPHADPVGRH